jgi:hypothetical protein
MNNKSLGSGVNRFLWNSRRFSSALNTSRHYPFNYSSSNPGYFTGGWVVELNFQIGLHQNDRPLLELIQLFFGVGKIYKLGKDAIQYRVTSHKDLAVIIDHFKNYPLITQKRADFELFKQALELIQKQNI